MDTFENMFVFTNTCIEPGHLQQIIQYKPGYIPNTAYQLNQTFVFQNPNTVYPVDILLTRINIIVDIPGMALSTLNTHISVITRYIINNIKKAMGYEVANNIGFKIYVYIHESIAITATNPLRANSNVIFTELTKSNITLLNRNLPYEMKRFFINMFFDPNWNLIVQASKPSQTTTPVSTPTPFAFNAINTVFGQNQQNPQNQPVTQFNAFGQTQQNPQIQPFTSTFGQNPQTSTFGNQSFTPPFGNQQTQQPTQPTQPSMFGLNQNSSFAKTFNPLPNSTFGTQPFAPPNPFGAQQPTQPFKWQ